MMFTKTDYTIDNLKVMKRGKLEAHGFSDVEGALHCIYVLNGKVEGTFFIENDGVVYKQEELKEA